MESKIMIDIDEDNQPVIQINYAYSNDVRDKMVKRFLEGFRFNSCWARFRYNQPSASEAINNSMAILRPIDPEDLWKEMEEILQMRVTRTDKSEKMQKALIEQIREFRRLQEEEDIPHTSN